MAKATRDATRSSKHKPIPQEMPGKPSVADGATPPLRSKSTPSAKPRSASKATLVARVFHPGPRIDGEAALSVALSALRAIDPDTVDHLVKVGGPPPLRLRAPGLEGLISIIMGQQLSVASASAINARLLARFTPLTAAALAAASDEELRACGLSAAKMRTVRAVSAAVAGGRLVMETLADLDPAVAHAALVALPGIGPWTADIFLLFCLGHPDAFPAGDLALQEAARHALKLDARPDAIAMEALAERWRPHRGVAARLLWAYYRVMKQGREGVVGGD